MIAILSVECALTRKACIGVIYYDVITHVSHNMLRYAIVTKIRKGYVVVYHF